MLEQKIMELPIPWINLKTISQFPLDEIAHRNEATVKTILPIRKIIFLPFISAIFPKGTKKTAEARRKDIAIQLSDIADNENSLLITGSATLTAAPINGLKKEEVRLTNSKIVLFT
jgi:hypothetical protein